MQRWYMWFIFAGLWTSAAIFNIYDKRGSISIGYNIFAAILFLILGIAQYYCNKKGKKATPLISVIAIAIVVILTLVITVFFTDKIEE